MSICMFDMALKTSKQITIIIITIWCNFIISDHNKLEQLVLIQLAYFYKNIFFQSVQKFRSVSYFLDTFFLGDNNITVKNFYNTDFFFFIIKVINFYFF